MVYKAYNLKTQLAVAAKAINNVNNLDQEGLKKILEDREMKIL